MQFVRLNLRVHDRNNRTGCLKTGKGHPGRGLVLWASGFHPVFEDDHFESKRRVRGLSTWALEAVRVGFRDPALMSSSCMTLRKLMILRCSFRTCKLVLNGLYQKVCL